MIVKPQSELGGNNNFYQYSKKSLDKFRIRSKDVTPRLKFQEFKANPYIGTLIFAYQI